MSYIQNDAEFQLGGHPLYEVYVEINVLGDIFTLAKRYFPLEIVGYLLGDLCRYKTYTYVRVLDYIPIASYSTTTSVRPDITSLGESINKLYESDLLIVGWYHTHPGYGCFLSDIDIDTQRKCFNKPYHVALVVDPIYQDAKFFKLDKQTGGYREAIACVIKKREDEYVLRP